MMGHELSGVVAALGDGVGHISVGDRVVLDPVMSCGACRTCRAGHGNVCADVKCFGVQTDGGFQEEIVVPADSLYRFPEQYSFVQAALAEPFSVAANILNRVSVKESDFVVIMGAGTIGLSLVQGAKAAGAKVLISDIEEAKLKKAKEIGADCTVNSGKEDLAGTVRKYTEAGADVVIDAVGTVKLTEQSIELAAPCGRIGVISFDARPAQIPAVAITKKEPVPDRFPDECAPISGCHPLDGRRGAESGRHGIKNISCGGNPESVRGDTRRLRRNKNDHYIIKGRKNLRRALERM